MDLADEEPLELFKRACHALQVPVDDETVVQLVHDLRRIAITLKYVHLRPRPQEIAPYHGHVITLEQPDPYDDTPAYPSVHATIGYGLANMYAEMYPQHAQEFYQVGDTVALQRIQSGRHFPSDNEYAKMIADLILGGG
jgi:membrane-associated phospholipid phosphatase